MHSFIHKSLCSVTHICGSSPVFLLLEYVSEQLAQNGARLLQIPLSWGHLAERTAHPHGSSNEHKHNRMVLREGIFWLSLSTCSLDTDLFNN
jgi:hypothetical protein